MIIMLPMFGDYYTATLLSGPQDEHDRKADRAGHPQRSGQRQGAALTIVLMFVGILMTYYLYSVARASREARS